LQSWLKGPRGNCSCKNTAEEARYNEYDEEFYGDSSDGIIPITTHLYRLFALNNNDIDVNNI